MDKNEAVRLVNMFLYGEHREEENSEDLGRGGIDCDPNCGENWETNSESPWWISCNTDRKVTSSMIDTINPWSHFVCKIPVGQHTKIVSKNESSENTDETITKNLKHNFNEWYFLQNTKKPSTKAYVGKIPYFGSHVDGEKDEISYLHDPQNSLMYYDLTDDISSPMAISRNEYDGHESLYYNVYKSFSLRPISFCVTEDVKKFDLELISSGWTSSLGKSGFACICSMDGQSKEDPKKYFLVIKASPNWAIDQYKKSMREEIEMDSNGMTAQDLVNHEKTQLLESICQLNVRRLAAQFMEILGISMPYVFSFNGGIGGEHAGKEDCCQFNRAKNGIVQTWDIPRLLPRSIQCNEDTCVVGNEYAVFFTRNYLPSLGKKGGEWIILPFGGLQSQKSIESETSTRSSSVTDSTLSENYEEDGYSSPFVLVKNIEDDDVENHAFQTPKLFPYFNISNKKDFDMCRRVWIKLGYNPHGGDEFVFSKRLLSTLVHSQHTKMILPLKNQDIRAK
jgi:hypothetical protein